MVFDRKKTKILKINFARYNKCVEIGMKSDCVLNDDELEEKRRVIIRNRIRRLQRLSFV